MVVLANLWFLVPAPRGLSAFLEGTGGVLLDQGSSEAQRSPQVEDAENQSDHDDVPSLVAQGPRGEKQFGNPMERRSDGDVFEHQQAMGQKEQCAGDASH